VKPRGDSRPAVANLDQDIGASEVRVDQARRSRPGRAVASFAFGECHQRLGERRTQAFPAARSQQQIGLLASPGVRQAVRRI
jgi:hypothetical protein